jgi:hypothetical protein
VTGRRAREAELRSRLLELAARLVDLAVEGNPRREARLAKIRDELARDPDRSDTRIAAVVGGRKGETLRLVRAARGLERRFPLVPGGPS